jgi:rod shape-determining protein MreC
MRNLIAFFVKHNFIFVFLLLQIVCFVLMLRNKHYQGSHLLNSSNKVVANVYQTSANTKAYFALREENDRLAKENAILKNYLKSSYAVLPLNEYKRNDTVYKQQYTYIDAKVVNASVNRRSNYLTLNIGSNQGIERDMAVIHPEGIVGIVKDVSPNFASVMCILHKDVRVNCQLKKDGSYGPLIWDGKDYQYCLLTDIPTHARMKKGDSVVTSELSGIFPEGILVGTVDSYERKQSEPFYTVKVKLSVDLKKANHVYVIKNKLKVERDSLEQTTQKQSDN